MRTSIILAAAVVSSCWALPAAAATTTDDFTFFDGSTVIATGSFSYNSSLSGVLGYSQLSAFSITISGQTYDLSFANAGVPGADYDSFSYDTTANTFQPEVISGSEGNFVGIMAATQLNGSLSSGFFFDPLPSQSALGNNDGEYSEYATGLANATFTSFAITPTPLPSSWTMMLIGFAGGLGFFAYRRRRDGALATA